MPTFPQMRIPVPKGGDEFEQIALAAAKMLWSNPNFQRNGRQGQAQAGVDLYGDDDLGRLVGVQCKNCEAFDIKNVEAAVVEAEAFDPPISALYVALGLPTDAKLQKDVRLLSEKRVKENKFPVGLIFWEDIVGELIKNPAEFRKHYPTLALPDGRQTLSPSTAVAALDLAYQGTCILKMAHLVLGDFGQLAGTPPRDFLYSLREIGQASTFVFDGEKGPAVAKACSDAELYLIEKLKGEHKNDKWLPFEELLSDIQTHVAITPYALRPVEIAAYSLGQILSRWYISDRDEKAVDPKLKAKIETFLGAINLDAKGMKQLVAIFKKFETDSIAPEVAAANGIYNLARSALLTLMVCPEKPDGPASS